MKSIPTKRARVAFHPRPMFRIATGRSGGLGQNRLRLRDDGTTRRTLVHRDVGQDLPVELAAGELQAVHEGAIGQALDADRRVDALDPECAERALLHLAVAIGVLPGLFDGLAGDADRVLATTVIALRLIEDPVMLGAGGYTPFDACHSLIPSAQ